MLESLPQTSLLAAFLAGLLSFISPCVLPLVPSYLMYITGLSLGQLSDSTERLRLRKTIVVNALLFIAGFSFVFIAFGASASFLGQVLADHQQFIRKVGGVCIILFGLYVMGILNFTFLMTERRIHLRNRPAGYVGSLLIGATFAAGWTPCVGPVLGTMLLYASTTETLTDGVILLMCYSVGLGLPFFGAAMGIDRFLGSFKRVRGYLGIISRVSGVFLVLFGVLAYQDSLTILTSFFEQYGIGTYVETDGG